MIKKQILILLFFLITVVITATTHPDIQYQNGHIWYIDPNGSDAVGNGTPENPWASLYHACNNVKTIGHIIHINAGRYIENYQCSLSPGVSIEGEGDASTIVSHFANTGYFQCAIILKGGYNPRQHISYIKLDGDNLACYQGIGVYQRSNVSIYGCSFKDILYTAVRFGGAGSINNSFYLNKVENCSGGIGDGFADQGGCLHLSGQTNFLCYDNIFTQNYRNNGLLIGDAIYGFEYIRGSKIYNNTINWVPQIDENWIFAIELFYAEGLEIYGNIIKGDIDFGKDVNYGIYDYGLYFHHNTIGWDSPINVSTPGLQLEQTAQGVIISHNTFKNIDNPIYFCQYKYPDDFVEDIWIYSNIFYNVGRSVPNNSGWAIRFESGSGDDNEDPPLYYNNLNILNNTIIAYANNPAEYGIELPTQTTLTNVMNIEVVNNIIIGFNNACIVVKQQDNDYYPAIGHFNIQTNILYNNGNNNNIQFYGVTLTNYTNDGGIKSDPLFVLYPTNLHLSSNISVAYKTGTLVIFPYNNTDYDGLPWNNPPSIGAYEFFEDLPIEELPKSIY